ncbi:DeoR/GlpR family DNA-binding transcription regulator [Sebaldella termitidis]|uniref:DeoR/GlpR family DNA-binding transcription regulator n=1 Tax=Sebaldella termitidis TaxID=826 RepID=UPI003EBD4428
MLEAERKQIIIDKLMKKKSIKVNELVEYFGVAKSTIRRDLDSLEASGVLKRTHGGAVLNENSIPSTSYNEKEDPYIEEKKLIAKKAASLVKDNDVVCLNSSTVTILIAKEITAKNVTIVTNNLDVAIYISQKEGIDLVVTGGNFIHKHNSMEGPATVTQFSENRYNIAFIGTNGIDSKFGVCTYTSLEAESKKIIIKNSKKTFIVCEHTKFDNFGFKKVASLDEIDGIITDYKINKEILEKYSEKTDIIIASPDNAD